MSPIGTQTIGSAVERGPSLLAHLRELRQYSHLVLSFAQRDIRARYKQTLFGVAWAVVQPFSLMLVFTLVFSKLARISSGDIPYPIFAYSALAFWGFFATTISQGTVAMTANGTLVRKIYFPRETLLLAVVASTAFDLVIALGLLSALLVYYQIAVGWTLLWVVPLLVLQALFGLAVICLTSSIHVFFRDVAHGLPLLLQLWMFATPVAYPLTIVPDAWRPFYLLNPMTWIIEGYRRVILEGRSLDLQNLAVAFLVAALLLVLAYGVFKRAERTFADVI